MCNALSPEKAVIWSVLHGLAPEDLRADYFTHPVYRGWFEAVDALRRDHAEVSIDAICAIAQNRGVAMRDIDRRALRRMMRIAPPGRIADNAELLGQALFDRHHGNAVHIEKLIN
ncbi:hypothetical protein [Magnetovibrio sp.]|uniref:hypothetical protein n=1 Tax=Magnetovibrio sp. TaxID=2024836 RepID=UPI002F943F3C